VTNSDEIYRFDGLAYGIRTHLLDFKPFLPWGRTPEPTCIICFDLSDHILYKTGTFSITGGGARREHRVGISQSYRYLSALIFKRVEPC